MLLMSGVFRDLQEFLKKLRYLIKCLLLFLTEINQQKCTDSQSTESSYLGALGIKQFKKPYLVGTVHSFSFTVLSVVLSLFRKVTFHLLLANFLWEQTQCNEHEVHRGTNTVR